ncbi:MAG: VOC family protein [Pseudomonadota bacterium]
MRPFDHLVLPVVDLATARLRYQALGFTVAPDGIHPFGTANCCVFLADGGFLEPLALYDRQRRDVALAEQANAAFVRTNAEFVASLGDEGFSHLVLRSADATADQSAFKQAGIWSGATRFSRTADNGAGESQTVAFELVFATDLLSPDAHFFCCQSLIPLEIDFSALRQHPNCVSGVRRIHSTAADPRAHRSFAERFVGASFEGPDEQIFADLGGVTWMVQTPGTLAEHMAIEERLLVTASNGMLHRAVEFTTEDMSAAESCLQAAELPFWIAGESIVVPPGPGQGMWAIFGPGG